jgi:ABC-type transporter Mla MlaB component
MTNRKQQTPARKRARPVTAKRGTPLRRTAVARGRNAAAKPVAKRGRTDGSLLLAAECTVAQADSLKSELERRLQEAEPVTLDVSALQRIDTAGLQLLAAFVRDRRTAGRAVTWRGQACALTTAAGLLGLRDMLELPREAG